MDSQAASEARAPLRGRRRASAGRCFLLLLLATAIGSAAGARDRVLTAVEVLDAHHATALQLHIEGGAPDLDPDPAEGE